MKFIVDEQLPQRLATWLREKGYDAIHADDIPHRKNLKNSFMSQQETLKMRI